MITVEEHVAKERMTICKSCEWLRPVINQCKKCSCLMNLKTKLESSKCPLRKW